VPAINDWRKFSEYYAAADIFFLPSREDPFPSVVLEAMAFGLPIVCFENATGAAELTEKEAAGIVVPYLDIAAAAQAISTLLTDPTAWNRTSNNAINCYRCHASFPDYAQKLLQILFAAKKRTKTAASRCADIEKQSVSKCSSTLRFY
jgi:glycosyltransferase involved in cell wall biosynthesis